MLTARLAEALLPAFEPVLNLAATDVTGPPCVAIAASGGGDSMALLALYTRLAQADPRCPPPVALSVDHGLRSGFAAEARHVADFCAANRVAHQVLAWRGDKPSTGLMAAARAARYGLLAQAARAAGADTLLVGHTRDDRLETAAMRAARVSIHSAARDPIHGPVHGIAGMEASVLLHRSIRLLRPLLHVDRASLRAWLDRHAVAYADDPTNGDARYERTRLRLAHAGMDAARKSALLAELDLAEQERAHVARRAAAFITSSLRLDAGHPVLAPVLPRDDEAAAFGLRYLAAALGSSPYPASPQAGARLCALVQDGANGTAFSVMRLTFRKTGGLTHVVADPRHGPPAPSGIAPFEMVCPAGLLPLAGSLAAALGAPAFELRPFAGQPFRPSVQTGHWHSAF